MTLILLHPQVRLDESIPWRAPCIVLRDDYMRPEGLGLAKLAKRSGIPVWQLIATVVRPFGGSATVHYQHTDAQGTPIAESALSASTSTAADQPYRRAGFLPIDPPSPVTPAGTLT